MPAKIKKVQADALAPEQRQRLEPRRGRPTSYPWKRWTDGRTYTVQQEKHFDPKPRDFARILKTRAAKDGLRVVAHVNGDKVKFQFSKSEAK